MEEKERKRWRQFRKKYNHSKTKKGRKHITIVSKEIFTRLFYIDVTVKRKLDYDPSPDGLNVKEVKCSVPITGQGFNSGKT